MKNRLIGFVFPVHYPITTSSCPRWVCGVIKEEAESRINWMQLDPKGTVVVESRTRSHSYNGFEPVDDNKDRIGG